jgi:GDPmannose 4,6-dehydratase
MNGVWLMLNQDEYDKYYNGTPKEYVLSSDVTHTIKEFVETAFKYININGYWKNNTNENINDKYYYINNNNEEILLVTINPEYYRKCDLNITCGNSSKIKYELGWEPKITFEELVKKMVNYDIELQNKKSL